MEGLHCTLEPLSLKDSIHGYLHDFCEEGHSLEDVCEAFESEAPAAIKTALTELVAEKRAKQTNSLEFWAVRKH